MNGEGVEAADDDDEFRRDLTRVVAMWPDLMRKTTRREKMRQMVVQLFCDGFTGVNGEFRWLETRGKVWRPGFLVV
ncbi:hypothetical protein HAX54_031306 [Datura stramonium]|uniref:Uncharacterized protein n=1 Tax=Datura stramonium TaxID=4076 RepID=A0ABS8SBY5_DATST|nr:hypothetical protein [Datura stramonium]